MPKPLDLTDEEKKQFLEIAERALHTGLDESAVMVGFYGEGDMSLARIEFTLQIGHCLLTGKPIILTVPHGAILPEKLKLAASAIVYYDPKHLQSMQAGLTKALTELGANMQ